jgi:hypothetical protein
LTKLREAPGIHFLSIDVPEQVGFQCPINARFSSRRWLHFTRDALGVVDLGQPQVVGCLQVEPRAGIAAELGAQALTVLTVSDHLRHDAHMDAAQRQTGVDAMTELTLDALCG